MTRTLYRALLLLHPPTFRRRFAGEMLCVFDDACAQSAAAGFCMSIALSLFRRWFRHPVLWRTTGAIAGGVVTLLPGIANSRLRFRAAAPLSSEILIVLIVGVLTAILATLIITVTLFHNVRRRRI
ncbi:MAG: hypothetical protein JO307_05610 [Bryobacterales bacterium]|nr:hypothetical protein [Bryobacterales bacterium]